MERLQRTKRMQPLETLDLRDPILHLHLPRLPRRDVRVCPPDAECDVRHSGDDRDRYDVYCRVPAGRTMPPLTPHLLRRMRFYTLLGNLCIEEVFGRERGGVARISMDRQGIHIALSPL